MKNPFTWVEIYVEDMQRAQKFYENVLQIENSKLRTVKHNLLKKQLKI